MIEKWLDIPQWEGIYKVSNLGRVKRIANGPGAVVGRIKKPFKIRGNYLMVKLSSVGRNTENRQVHRIVLEAFVGPCPNGMVTNHKNGDPSDNNLDNLEWVTRTENLNHSYRELGRIPTRGIQFPQAKLNPTKVKEIRRLSAAGKSYSEIANLFKVSRSAIAHVIKGRSWKHVTN